MKALVLAVGLMLAGTDEKAALAAVESEAPAVGSPHLEAIRAGRIADGMSRDDVRLALRARREILGGEPGDLDTVRMTRTKSTSDASGSEETWTYSELNGESERLVIFRNGLVTWIGTAADHQRATAEAQREAEAAFLAAHGPATWSKEGYQDLRWGMPRSEAAKLIPSAGLTQPENGLEVARDITSLLDREFGRVFVYEDGLLKEVGLYSTHVSPRDSDVFAELRTALQKKYGKPSSTQEESSTRGAIWKLPQSVIVLGFSPFEMEPGGVSIRYLEAGRYQAEKDRDEAKRRALEKQL